VQRKFSDEIDERLWSLNRQQLAGIRDDKAIEILHAEFSQAVHVLLIARPSASPRTYNIGVRIRL
jgi:hypothetical protein